MKAPNDRRILAEGNFLRLVAGDGWEWVERINSPGAVIMTAVTAQRQLVLVEQYRVPLGCRTIELPAGLAGDVPEARHEAMIEAARRELLEETGYASDDWRELLCGTSSPGLTTEAYSLFLARDARKVADGGGDDSEDIRVHLAPLDGVDAWLDEKRRSGLMVDPKIYIGLYFAREGS